MLGGMAVYVDDARIRWRGRRWSHLVAETPAELHAAAQALGIPRIAAQDRGRTLHYDLPDEARDRAITEQIAEPIQWRDLVGLRDALAHGRRQRSRPVPPAPGAGEPGASPSARPRERSEDVVGGFECEPLVAVPATDREVPAGSSSASIRACGYAPAWRRDGGGPERRRANHVDDALDPLDTRRRSWKG